MRILNVIGIVAGIFYAVITFWQWKDLRHNFEVDQRAWVRIESEPFPEKLDEGTVLSLKATLSNTGRNPATRIAVHTQIEIVSKCCPPSLHFDKTKPGLGENLLFPGSSRRFPIPVFDKPHTLTKDEIHDLNEGRSYLAMFAQVTYGDPFGTHWTRFCVSQNYSTDWYNGWYNGGRCMLWNSIGDGAPPDK